MPSFGFSVFRLERVLALFARLVICEKSTRVLLKAVVHLGTTDQDTLPRNPLLFCPEDDDVFCTFPKLFVRVNKAAQHSLELSVPVVGKTAATENFAAAAAGTVHPPSKEFLRSSRPGGFDEGEVNVDA